MPAAMERELIRNDLCFVCGKNNAQGLRLAFAYPEPGRAETSCSIPEHFSGWQRMTHGGLLATLLDEAMAHACISREVKGRVLEAQGEVLNAGGEAVARGSGRFLKV
jgi:acyl-coenzyme A thioesterase PaaI-like protein